MNCTSILVCGGTGFLGKNIIRYFSNKPNIRIRATYFRSEPDYTFDIEWVQADLRELEKVRELLNDIDIVFQYAATTSGARDIINRPYMHVTDNVIMNSYLIRESFENNVKHFIFPSCTVMYKNSSTPLKESDLNENEDIYDSYYGSGNTKLYLEKMCKFFSNFNKTKYTVLRQSNLYGPYDKYNLENSHVLSATIVKVMSSKNIIRVWGNGKEKRDFLHVDDLMILLENVIEMQYEQYHLVNTSFGLSISISDLVSLIIEQSGKNLLIKYDKNKPSIPINIHINNEKAKKLFNWKPNTDLKSGLKNTIDWYKENFISS
tara:strand:- start:634 stop:1590 length:957 start_codon:yes stop_codon:yes gene_type:complete